MIITPKINLVIQLLMGLGLLTGAVLARKRKFRAHGICQSVIIIANLVIIILYMGPLFLRVALPSLPNGLGQTFYLAVTLHAVFGVAAEGFGIYIILCAGTGLVPASLRFKNYRRWMRSELCVWWLAIVFGVLTFFEWNIAGPRISVAETMSDHATVATASPTPKTVVINMTNFSFDPPELVVESGTRIVWRDVAGRHSVRSDDGTFTSEILQAGGEFEHVFDQEGTFPYYCTLHGSAGGHDMAGRIMVKGSQSKGS